MKTFYAKIQIRAECEADAKELLKDYTGKETHIEIENIDEKDKLIEEWDGGCPKCGNCNHEDIDYQHDTQESLFWLKCEDCGTEFQTRTITSLVGITKEAEEEEEEGLKTFRVEAEVEIYRTDEFYVEARDEEEALQKVSEGIYDGFKEGEEGEASKINWDNAKAFEEDEEELDFECDYFDDSEEYQCELCSTEHATMREAEECCQEE